MALVVTKAHIWTNDLNGNLFMSFDGIWNNYITGHEK